MDAKRTALVATLALLACVAFFQIAPSSSFFGHIQKAIEPLLTGCVIAYLANLIMAKIEGRLFPKSNNAFALKARRPLAIFISFILLIAIASLVIVLVSSQLHNTLISLAKGAEAAWSAILNFTEAAAAKSEVFASMGKLLNWEDIANNVMDKLGNSDTVVNSALGVGDSLVRTTTNIGLGFVFSIYLLMAKERVSAGAKTLSRSLLEPKWNERATQAASIANESFSRFIVGQCTEALILGGLCFVGMSILRLPHAFTIGLCVGTTALIPLLGAWIGGAVGALIILPDSPEKALLFLVFFMLLQAFENHVIYPRTMKHATGVSTIWVIASVIAGGAMGGIAGIVLAVPLVATGQELLKNWWKPSSANIPTHQCRQREE